MAGSNNRSRSTLSALWASPFNWEVGRFRSVITLAVPSDGSYDVPEGLISSFPVRVDGQGGWEIVQGLELTPFLREKLDATAAELASEREMVADLLKA